MSGKDRHCTVGSKPTLRANPRSVRYPSGKDRHCTVGSKPTLRANPRSVRYQTYSSLFTPTPRHRRRPLPRLVPAKAISAGLDGLPESHQAARVEFNEK